MRGNPVPSILVSSGPPPPLLGGPPPRKNGEGIKDGAWPWRQKSRDRRDKERVVEGGDDVLGERELVDDRRGVELVPPERMIPEDFTLRSERENPPLRKGACRGVVSWRRIAAAWGVRDSGKRRRIVSIEPGGVCEHPRLPTKNILRCGEARRIGFRHAAGGFSRDKGIVAAVRDMVQPGSVDLLIIDADGDIKRNATSFFTARSCRRTAGCVLDDYWLSRARNKDVIVDPFPCSLSCEVEQLGFYGWATWVGRWRGVQRLNQTV